MQKSLITGCASHGEKDEVGDIEKLFFILGTPGYHHHHRRKVHLAMKKTFPSSAGTFAFGANFFFCQSEEEEPPPSPLLPFSNQSCIKSSKATRKRWLPAQEEEEEEEECTRQLHRNFLKVVRIHISFARLLSFLLLFLFKKRPHPPKKSLSLNCWRRRRKKEEKYCLECRGRYSGYLISCEQRRSEVRERERG